MSLAKTREQRCWVHKTANVLASCDEQQRKQARLQEIWMARSNGSEAAFDGFMRATREIREARMSRKIVTLCSRSTTSREH